MGNKKKLSASLEDYLEAIYRICSQKGQARSKEIMAMLQVTGPSVTEALRLLADKNMVKYAPYQTITLTEGGRTVAKKVVARHEALRLFFVEVLHVESEIAEAGACRIEHVVPSVVIERMIRYIDFLNATPEDGRSLAACFSDYLKDQGGNSYNSPSAVREKDIK